jgi:nucleotide-binding universal stress UspA family protein
MPDMGCIGPNSEAQSLIRGFDQLPPQADPEVAEIARIFANWTASLVVVGGARSSLERQCAQIDHWHAPF